MKWMMEQPAEAVELVDAIHRGMESTHTSLIATTNSLLATQSTVEEMIVSLEQMRETADRMDARISPHIEVDAPSISPNSYEDEQ